MGEPGAQVKGARPALRLPLVCWRQHSTRESASTLRFLRRIVSREAGRRAIVTRVARPV
jgi:hypothetical protein